MITEISITPYKQYLSQLPGFVKGVYNLNSYYIYVIQFQGLEVQMSLIGDNFNTGLDISNSDLVYRDNRIALLKERVENLNKLCSELDPYKEIPLAYQETLVSLGVREFDDPFTVTNKLVTLLEDSIEELQSLEKLAE